MFTVMRYEMYRQRLSERDLAKRTGLRPAAIRRMALFGKATYADKLAVAKALGVKTAVLFEWLERT